MIHFLFRNITRCVLWTIDFLARLTGRHRPYNALQIELTGHIAEQLFEAQPETDPLSIRFTDLLRWVTDLEDFSDDPQDSSEGKLEALQMAWLEIY